MTTKTLFTAAEARRIDIERGGEGKIKLELWSEPICFCSELKNWFFEGGKSLCWSYFQEICKTKWLPVTASLEASTPEPEQVISKPEKLMLENLLETNAKRCKQIEQLEKELAELKKERDNDIYYRLYTDAQKQRDEYKNNYHEILADHGELTRKFDEIKESCNPFYLNNALNCVRQLQDEIAELKEKQLTKEDFQLIQIGRLILEVNKRAWELREADL